MKKFISFLIAAVFTLNLCTSLVFASDADYTDKFIDILYTDMLKGSYEGTMSIKNNNSWEFIDELIKSEENDSYYNTGMSQLFDPVDIKSLAESTVNLDGTVKADYNISENYDKIQMHAALTLNKPLVLSDTLSFSVNTALEMYMDADFSDLKNPVYKLTIKYPINKKYIYIDYSEVLKQTLSQLPDSEISEEIVYSAIKTYMDSLIKAAKASYKKNATVTYSNSTYTMKMDDKGFKSFMFDIFDTVLNSMDFVKFMSLESENFEEDLAEMKKDFEDFKLLAEKITILGDGGYTISCKMDNNNKPCEMTSAIDISLNLYDIANVFGLTDIAADLSDIGRGKCGISINANQNYKLSNIGNDIAINYPVLSNENSVDLAKLMEEELTKENDYNYTHNQNYFSATYDGYRVEQNGETYLPTRAFVDSLYYSNDDNIMVNDGIVTIIAPKDSVLPFNTLSFYENGNSLFVNGQEFWLEHPTFEADGITYLPLCALRIINIDVTRISTSHNYDIATDTTYVSTRFYANLME